MLNKLQQTILKLLSSALIGRETEIYEEELNLGELITECQQQGVLYLVLDKLLPLCGDKKDKYSLIAYSVRHAQQLNRILAAQDELFSLLYDIGLRPVIIKGWATAQYYSSPENRTFGDIDILLPKKQIGKARDCLLINNFELEPGPSNPHHVGVHKNGISVELHFSINGMPNNEEHNNYLEEFFGVGLNNQITRIISGHEMHLLPEAQNGLVLLLHIRAHINEGLGLRQLIDWMVFVKLYIDDMAFKSQWNDIFYKSGLTELAKVSTYLCVKYFGLEGNYSWCADADKNTADWMIKYIFEQGNFGHKKRRSDDGAKAISATSGFWGLMKYIYRSGVCHWSTKNRQINPETKPILRIFAWFYGLGHYISELHKKGGLPYLFKSYREARERRQVFSKLGLYN